MVPVLFFIYKVIQIILLVLLGIATLYVALFAAAGLFYRQKKYQPASAIRKIAVLIPGYKEDEVIVEVAQDALAQDYPRDHFEVIIIADSFQPETLAKFNALPVRVIEVKFEKSTKSKALNKAMEQIQEPYDIAVILDADNLMAPGFLPKINAAFERDIIAVQGHRKAKNLNTSLAILDAISEEINNHIFRKGHRVLGLSSAIIGSGMAFRYDYFRNLMLTVTAVGGFDKEIELKMLKEGRTIEYLDDAVVLDEKVQKAEVFGNQRRRWLSAQFHYFRKDILPALKALITQGNIDYFDKAFQFIQPPRILLLGAVLLSGLFFITGNLVIGNLPTLNLWWILLVLICIAAFVFSVPLAFYRLSTLKAVASLPGGMWLMLKSLLRIKGANKQFIHTKHTTVHPKPGS